MVSEVYGTGSAPSAMSLSTVSVEAVHQHF